MSNAAEPDQIIWKNLRYRRSDGSLRYTLVKVVAVIFAFVSLSANILFSTGDSKYADIDCTGTSKGLGDAYTS